MAKGTFGKILEYGDMALDSTQLASMLLRLFRGSNASQGERESAAKVEGLMKDGKPDEALEEALKTWATGFGMSDEMRLLRDIAILVDGQKLSSEDALKLNRFLKDLGPRSRNRFRKAFVSERDGEFRRMVILVLATLKDDDERQVFLDGSGMFDKSMLEKALETLDEPLAVVAEFAKDRNQMLRDKHEQRQRDKQALIAARPQAGKYRTWLNNRPVLKTILTFGLTSR